MFVKEIDGFGNRAPAGRLEPSIVCALIGRTNQLLPVSRLQKQISFCTNESAIDFCQRLTALLSFIQLTASYSSE